jgi:hypothetical protein
MYGASVLKARFVTGQMWYLVVPITRMATKAFTQPRTR